mgnify:CR=1 FL=1|tara:strand:+ start:2733 stop:3596 length:864 start_codon:yes stop_codon:yes gene_type:complete
MINILVTGSKGQLGSEIKKISKNYNQYKFTFVDILKLDITKYVLVRKLIENKLINIILNCAAYTAVDKAESEKELANSINHLAVKNLAQIAKDYNIKLVHISTDYVFDGQNSVPYSEFDKPNPCTIYGKTKLDGEIAINTINPASSIIIRTSWVYSNFGNNFVKTMLNLSEKMTEIRVVCDQVGSPTNASDLAKTIMEILPKLENTSVEIYHYSNEGVCSWYDLAFEIFKIRGIKSRLIPVSSSEYKTEAIRPNYSLLSKRKIKQNFNINIPHWKTSLIQTLLNSKI